MWRAPHFGKRTLSKICLPPLQAISNSSAFRVGSQFKLIYGLISLVKRIYLIAPISIADACLRTDTARAFPVT